MKLIKRLVIIWLACSFNSCVITDYVQTLPLEIMKPAAFNIPDSVRSVGIFNLSSIQKNDRPLEFIEGIRIKKDSATRYSALSNTCTKALADLLVSKEYFGKVRNFGDSVSYLKSETPLINLYKKLGVDAIVFLNIIDFKIVALDDAGSMIVNNAHIAWSVSYKNDTLSYWYNQRDTLVYSGEDLPYAKNQLQRIRAVAENSGEYLGKVFGSKLIPDWVQIERMYYRSGNAEMLKAEVFAKKDEWLKAAEIWNKMAGDKNEVLAAKASYNMALACEMEGRLDPAIDWLVKSYSVLKEKNMEHQVNCQRYIKLLALRKKEIEKLDKQVRIPAK